MEIGQRCFASLNMTTAYVIRKLAFSQWIDETSAFAWVASPSMRDREREGSASHALIETFTPHLPPSHRYGAAGSPLPFPKERGETKSASMKKRAAQLQCRLRFSIFQPIDTAVGQQHRVRAKRKRRRAYVQRKKTAQRASATRPTPAKQRPKKEPEPTE